MEKPCKKTWKKNMGTFFVFFKKFFFARKNFFLFFSFQKKLFEKYKKSTHVFFPCFFTWFFHVFFHVLLKIKNKIKNNNIINNPVLMLFIIMNNI
jgi:hypothetical protein